MKPEEQARQIIDKRLTDAGWVIQDRKEMSLGAGRGVAVREYPLATGYADYLLFVDRKAVGVIEAKAVGRTLGGVIHQSQSYSVGLKDKVPHWHNPLPKLYESTGVETMFTDLRDPAPRSRRVFTFHRPETLAEWAAEAQTLRARMQQMPPLIEEGLWDAQVEAIDNLEKSFNLNRPRALIQMATGSGKTFTAVNFVYRLVKHSKAKRVLFLVDRNNLGKQANKEFQQFDTPDDGRKFTELYNVQHLQSNVLDSVSKVHITTIQRLYSMLSNEAEFDAALEEHSMWELDDELKPSPKDVIYNPQIPIEYYDFVVIDECHRSIYNIWRQVLDYFDSFLIGLTATPSAQTIGFFNQNMVMEYSRQRAVTDGVNVDGEVYNIRTQVTEDGGEIEAGYQVNIRNLMTRDERQELLDEDIVYSATQLDRSVVNPSQIRTIIRTYRDRLFSEIVPGRTIVPKTLIFAKDDNHAESIVEIIREEFGKGNDFCQKITYKVSGKSAEDLIAEFRNSYNPRIAVTVDMIATGTDVKPLEVLIFMRDVKSRKLYDQMVGRGTRVIDDNDLAIVTPDAGRKDRFVIVDAVGLDETRMADNQTLERNRTVPFKRLLNDLAQGVFDADSLSSLVGRLSTLERKLTDRDRDEIAKASNGQSVREIAQVLLDSLDLDRHVEAARQQFEVETPSAEQVATAGQRVMEEATYILADNPTLRNALIELQQRKEQIIDTVTQDVLRDASYDTDAAAKASATVENFRMFIEENIDQITALQLLYSRPYTLRNLTYRQLEELAAAIQQSPYNWSTESLWRAYAQLEQHKVKGASTERKLTDLVSLVRRTLQQEGELIPYTDKVQERYEQWLADQQSTGVTFTDEQRWWLDRIAEQIGLNLSVQPDDFDYGDFFDKGGRIGAMRALGEEWLELVEKMNEDLVVVE